MTLACDTEHGIHQAGAKLPGASALIPTDLQAAVSLKPGNTRAAKEERTAQGGESGSWTSSIGLDTDTRGDWVAGVTNGPRAQAPELRKPGRRPAGYGPGGSGVQARRAGVTL
eukprot:7174281-Pyramimonas_sp.AAC.1